MSGNDAASLPGGVARTQTVAASRRTGTTRRVDHHTNGAGVKTLMICAIIASRESKRVSS